MSEMRTGRAGLAYALLMFILTIIVGAGLYAVFQQPVNGFLDQAAATSSTQEASTGIGYIRTAWIWAPMLIALLWVLMIIASAVVQSNRGGP